MLVKRSSSIGQLNVHICFVVKYRHKIFDDKKIEQRCKELLLEAAQRMKIRIDVSGFDRDHVHLVIDLGIRSIPEITKQLKGYSGYKLLREFPEVKARYFWGSGLWSPVVFFQSLGHDYDAIEDYVRGQGIPSVSD